MHIPQVQNALSLAILLAGPLVAPLSGADELHDAGSWPQPQPVVIAPALPPILNRIDGSVLPQPGHEEGDSLEYAQGEGMDCGPHAAPAGGRFGASSRALFGAQVANGQAALMVLYQYDFSPGKADLAPAGWRKLQRQAALLVQTPFPLIIEPTGSTPALDDARRHHVLARLASLPYPVPPARVIVAPPPARGMSGVEAEGVYLKFLEMVSGGEAAGATPVEAPVYGPNR